LSVYAKRHSVCLYSIKSTKPKLLATAGRLPQTGNEFLRLKHLNVLKRKAAALLQPSKQKRATLA